MWDVLGHLDLPRYHTDDVEPSSGPPEQLGVDFGRPKKIFLPEKKIGIKHIYGRIAVAPNGF